MVFVMVWPLWAGMIAVNDDIKFIRVPAHAQPLLMQITQAWAHSPSFRPLELLIAVGCDERTLDCMWAMPSQILGLLALVWGVVMLAKIVLPTQPWVAPMAVIWTALSPSTTCSAWQMDASSQTWSAALGIWACVLCWRCFVEARQARIAYRSLAMLTLIFFIGVNVKETFYGWSAGIGIVAICATAWLLMRERAAGIRASLVLLPVIAVPIAHMAARWCTGAMSQSMDTKQESRYQLEFGMNLFLNAGQSIAGTVGTGPFYLLPDAQAALITRALPAIAGIAELALLVAVFEFSVLRNTGATRLRWWPIVLLCAAGLLSLSVTFPMGSVGELYGLGANVCVALLLAVAVTALWRMTTENDRHVSHGIVVGCAAVMIGIGLYGMVGRANHFASIWQRTRMANAQILNFMDTRPAAPKYADAPESVIYFPTSCRPPYSYSAYIMPTAQAIDIINTTCWMKQLHPKYPTTFSIDVLPTNPGPYELVIDCDAMPTHAHW